MDEQAHSHVKKLTFLTWTILLINIVFLLWISQFTLKIPLKTDKTKTVELPIWKIVISKK